MNGNAVTEASNSATDSINAINSYPEYLDFAWNKPERALPGDVEHRANVWLTYDLPPDLLGKTWKGRFRGQEQKWFAMRFEGDDADINIAPEKGEKPEFDHWRWEPMANLPDMVVPFKRDVYVQVVAAFRHLAP